MAGINAKNPKKGIPVGGNEKINNIPDKTQLPYVFRNLKTLFFILNYSNKISMVLEN